MIMKNLKLKGVLAIRLLGATIAIMPAQPPANAETSTQSFLEGCRSLVSSSGATTDGAANCQSILEGAIGAFGLLTKEYYPISTLQTANFVKKLFLLGVLIAASILVLLEGFDGDVRTEERSTSCAVL